MVYNSDRQSSCGRLEWENRLNVIMSQTNKYWQRWCYGYFCVEKMYGDVSLAWHNFDWQVEKLYSSNLLTVTESNSK